MAKKQTVKRKRVRRFLSPSHTKGYYRFSKEFPSVTDSDGYRDNDLIVNSPAKKASVRRRLIAVSLFVFVVTFFAASVCFSMSDIPVKQQQETVTGETEKVVLSGYKAVCLKGEILSRSSAESVISELLVYGVNAVIIDFKDATGNFYFKPSITVSGEAIHNASDNAQKIVKEFQDADISVIARFSCFADDIYARTNQNEAAFVSTGADESSTDAIWYSGGEDSHAWLNPYSVEVQYYLRVTAQDVEDMNVDGILFDNVQLPLNAQADGVQFVGQTEETASAAMASFIKILNNNYIECKTAAFLTREYALDSINSSAAPDVFLSGCDYIIPDIRLSLMPENTVIGTRQYGKAHLSPLEFVTDYINGIRNLATGEEYSFEIIPMFETSDVNGKELSALHSAKGNSYIMYNSDSVYTADNFMAD